MSPEVIALRPPPGTWRGLDTAGDDSSPGNVITPDIARQLRALGYWWVARYTRPDGIVLDNPRPGGDWQGCYSLSLAESRWILDNGLGIVPVQFGIFGDANRGRDAGRNAATCASRLGFPTAVHQFSDVEGSAPQRAGAAAVKAYQESWAAGNRSGGYPTGMYLTGQVPLTAAQLYGLAGVTCYWSAAGPVPPNPLPRGYAIEQDPPLGDYPDTDFRVGDKRVAGMLCDTDTIRTDRYGFGPVLAATPATAAMWYGEAFGNLARNFADNLTA